MITSNNQLIERDATSSGVQIASALSRNAEMAAVVNLLPSNEQRDIYKVVAEMTNRKWAELGFDQRLVRGDTKRATIAIVYGGSHKTAYESLAETIGLSFNQAPDVFRAFWQSLSETMTGVMQVEKYITKLCNIIQQSGVHRLEFPVPTGGVCVFEAAHPTVRVRGQVKVAKARTDEEAAAEVDRSRDEIKDRVADSSMVTTYETHLPAGVKQFPGKSVTAAYIQGFDAAVLATTQLKLFEAGVQAWCKHDAFLVDPADERTLIKCFRESMVELFDGYPLDDLRDQLSARYSVELPSFDDIYGYGDFDPRDMLGAQYLIAA